MSELVDRVAKVIEEKFTEQFCGTLGLEQEEARAFARAAIEAMREPTPEMIQTVRDHVHEIGPNDNGEAWRFMIDAALK